MNLLRHGVLIVLCFVAGCAKSGETAEGYADAVSATALEPDAPPTDDEKAALARIEKMVADGKDLNAVDPETKLTPLFAAATAGHVHEVRLLLEKGADPNILSENGFSALHAAAAYDRRLVAKTLLENGAEADRPCGTNLITPLQQAAAAGSPAIMQMLLNRRADPYRKSSTGGTLVHLAAEGRNLQAMHIALRLGLKPDDQDKDGWTPLHTAAFFDAPDLVEHLLSLGLDLEAKNAQGGTPLHTAAMGERRDYQSLVIEESGKAPVTKDLRVKRPPADVRSAESAVAGSGDAQEIKLTADQIDRLGKVYTMSQQSRKSEFDEWSSHTYQYALFESAAAVRLLIAKGAKVNEKDAAGKTPLDLASSYDLNAHPHERVAEILREHGGKPGSEVP
jgi:ankyrin repeat protein